MNDAAVTPEKEEEVKKHLVFVANPFSGTRKKNNLSEVIEKFLDHTIYTYEVKFTQAPGHATLLASEAANHAAFAVIAVGGDGTINEVAGGLLGTETALGLLPYGSGNGFAYHLGIRRSIQKAFEVINRGHSQWIDTATANGKLFLNVAGLGLDATVAYKTKFKSRRGFLPYFLQTIRESIGFKYMDLRIECPQGFTQGTTSETSDVLCKNWHGSYAMAVIANGSVYGYGFYIAPAAKLSDGLFDVLLVKKVPVFRYVLLATRMLNRSFHQSPIVEYFRTPEIRIEIVHPEYAHLDGEGYPAESSTDYKISKASMRILSYG